MKAEVLMVSCPWGLGRLCLSLHIWPLEPLPTPIRISWDSIKGIIDLQKNSSPDSPALSRLPAPAAMVITLVRTTVALH